MTVLPESPVRECLERVAGLMLDEMEVAPDAPSVWAEMIGDSAWPAGYVAGLSAARAIVALQIIKAGQETTRFEYRVVGVVEGKPPEHGEWHPAFDEARVAHRDYAAEGLPFDDLYIERRTVTVTEPVRLDSDGDILAVDKAEADTLTVPADVVRMAAEHSGRLADIVRTCDQEERADALDLFAEYAQKTANNEPVDWPPVLEDLAAREAKWRGLEPGA